MRNYLFLLFYFTQAQTQPRIETQNGHLKFTGTKICNIFGESIVFGELIWIFYKAHNGKNIEFVSTGGSVFINGEDFGNFKTQLDSHEE